MRRMVLGRREGGWVVSNPNVFLLFPLLARPHRHTRISPNPTCGSFKLFCSRTRTYTRAARSLLSEVHEIEKAKLSGVRLAQRIWFNFMGALFGWAALWCLAPGMLISSVAPIFFHWSDRRVDFSRFRFVALTFGIPGTYPTQRWEPFMRFKHLSWKY